MEDMENYAYTLFRTIPISASTKANGKEQDNRYWGCRKGQGKRKLP